MKCSSMDILSDYPSRVVADKAAMEADPIGYVNIQFATFDAIDITSDETIDIGANIITIPSNKAILSSGATPGIITGTTGSGRIAIEGATVGSAIDLAGDTLMGSNVFRLASGSGIVEGDWVCVRASLDGPINNNGSVASAASASEFNGTNNLDFDDGNYVGRLIVFTSGALEGESQTVGAYTGATRTFTMSSPFSDTPAAGDTFNIWSQENTTTGCPQQLAFVHYVETSQGFDDLVTGTESKWDYLAAGVSQKASLSKVTLVENAALYKVNLQNVRMNFKLAKNTHIYVPKITGVPLTAMSKTDFVACDGLTLCAHGAYPAGSGPNQLVQLVGVRHLDIDASQTGGGKDGIRIYGCANVVSKTRVWKIPKQGLWLFNCNLCTIDIVSIDSIFETSGAVEGILFDYSSNITASQIYIADSSNGDAIEIRGNCVNLDLNNVTVVTDEAGSTSTGLNIHGRLVRNLDVENLYIIGCQNGIDIRDGADDIRIHDGQIIKRGGEGGNCIRIGRHMIQPIKNVYVTDMRLTPTSGGRALLASDADNGGYKMSNINVTDNTIIASDMDDRIKIVDAVNVTESNNVQEWPPVVSTAGTNLPVSICQCIQSVQQRGP